eukprot:3394799-Prymnesium_polylepis.1
MRLPGRQGQRKPRKTILAFVELLQNAADHVRKVIEASEEMRNSRISDISFTDNRIEFKFKGATYLY